MDQKAGVWAELEEISMEEVGFFASVSTQVFLVWGLLLERSERCAYSKSLPRSALKPQNWR